MKKKITRGISKDFAEAFKKSELYKLYGEHKDELFIGVRNDYLNLYYNCDRIAKIEYKKQDEKIDCEIDKYYLDGNHYNSKDKEKRYKIEQKKICKQYEVIKQHSNDKATPEKKAQSKLVLLNNENLDSNWFCIDVEYVKSFNNRAEKKEADFNGRFDIIALSKIKPHKVALIELKYGSGAIGGTSGIYKHVADFSKFCEKGYFEGQLKQEIIEIVKSQKELGIAVQFESPEEFDILTPEFYFITLDNNAEKENASTPKQTMAGYLFNDKRWGCRKLTTKDSVEKMFGDITKKDNKFFATFLFSKATLENIGITDIVDGTYNERILPA
ncbi:MAG: hypothetical protein CVU10_03475 [Bacteroidetes bacterium HGW-Bacteroidetes-5]|nr:MAG: hypothetical protein CVU10_03475 [Bacteroidetes bacterium HGW-Bacteroidetes-5]